MDFSKNELMDFIEQSNNKADLYELMGMSRKPNSRMIAPIKECFNKHGIDLDNAFRMKIYEIRVCPVCDSSFEVRKTEAKITCSYGCSNTHFRSGINNGSHSKALADEDKSKNSQRNYRTICFHYHDKKCVVCNEDKIVAVHHYDENHYNNNPENLIPMCPTHHQYMHSNYKSDIAHVVDDYIKNWKDNNKDIL